MINDFIFLLEQIRVKLSYLKFFVAYYQTTLALLKLRYAIFCIGLKL